MKNFFKEWTKESDYVVHDFFCEKISQNQRSFCSHMFFFKFFSGFEISVLLKIFGVDNFCCQLSYCRLMTKYLGCSDTLSSFLLKEAFRQF